MSPAVLPLMCIPVGIVVERYKADSPWTDFVWRAVAVLPDEPDTRPWTVLREESGRTLFYAGSATVDLYSSETARYRDNLASGSPSIWTVLTPAEGAWPYSVAAATADPAEGEAFTESGANLVEAVPMSEGLDAFKSGQVALQMNFFAFFPGLYKDPNVGGDKIGFFVNPAGPAAQATQLGGQGISVVSYSKNQAEALQYIKWFSGGDVQKKWWALGGYSCAKSVLNDPSFPNSAPFAKEFLQSMGMVVDFWAEPSYAQLLQAEQKRVHGEPGRRRVPLGSADAIAAEMLNAILGDLAPSKGSEVLLLINGFGATPLIELYLMANSAKRILDGAGITATRFLTGSYVTSLDMLPRSMR